MKFFILAALFLSVTCTKSTKENADRREGISYSTSVVHSDPNFPDQQAQSSIDFKLETPDYNQNQQNNGYYAKESTKAIFHDAPRNGYSGFNGPPAEKFYASNNNVGLHELTAGEGGYYGGQKELWTQKPAFRYNQPVISKGMYPQVYSHPQFGAKTKQFTSASSNKPVASSFPTNTNSQSFNVGYSVKFGGKPYKAPRVESDVITGSRKEEVGKPLKAQKYLKPVGLTSSQILSQSHITPKTQKQLAFLETIQGTSKPLKEFEKANSPWKSLSPSVEIYKSREVSLSADPYNSYFDGLKSNGYYDSQNANSERFEQVKGNPGHFDHQRALGKSEGFDYTNAVDFSGLSAANVHQFMQPTVYDKQMNKAVNMQTNQYTSTAELFSFANNQAKPQNSAGNSQLQQQSLLNIAQPQLNYHSQALTGSPKGPLPKLPMDTSLLRDPVLTVDKQGMKVDGSKIPIHFDTTLIQEIGKSYGALYNDAQDVKEIKLNDKGYNPEKESTKVIQSYDQPLNDQGVVANSAFDGKFKQFDQSAFNSQTEAAFSAKPEYASETFGSQKTAAYDQKNQHEQSGYNTKPNQYEQNAQYGQGQDQNANQYGLDQKTNQYGLEQKTNQYGVDQKVNQYGQDQKASQYENFNQPYETDDMKFAYPQNGLFNPSLLQKIPKSPPKKTTGEYYRLRKPNMYMVKEPVEEAAQQPPSQFKVFGKPANGFMRHEYEKFQKTRSPEKPRQPRINPKRVIRDYNLETDLKPPPLHYNRPRRMHKYETH